MNNHYYILRLPRGPPQPLAIRLSVHLHHLPQIIPMPRNQGNLSILLTVNGLTIHPLDQDQVPGDEDQHQVPGDGDQHPVPVPPIRNARTFLLTHAGSIERILAGSIGRILVTRISVLITLKLDQLIKVEKKGIEELRQQNRLLEKGNERLRQENRLLEKCNTLLENWNGIGLQASTLEGLLQEIGELPQNDVIGVLVQKLLTEPHKILK